MHRPRWEDWSFPKGKLDRGEPAYAAAVREVEEETGLLVRLGPPLSDTDYRVSGGQLKKVHYWCAKAPKSADVSDYQPNNEIDALRWVPASRALSKLSYPYDSDLLEEFLGTVYNTSPLLIVRHAHALSRKEWDDDDAERPLRAEGKEEAERLVALLASYGVTRVVSSDAVRCVDTVLPYVNAHGAKLRLDASISQHAFEEDGMRQRVQGVLARDKAVAICSHRPVLPHLLKALGVDPVALDPGASLVLHRRDGVIHALEQYPTP